MNGEQDRQKPANVCQFHSGIEKSIISLEKTDENLKQTDDLQWDEINGLKKALTRLVPVWTTVVLMAMSALTASALTFAGMVIKFSGQK
jgi:hypothetical protein